MGREIRRIPPNWEHPKSIDGRGEYRPLHDQDYESAADAYLAALLTWERGDNPHRLDAEERYYWDWAGMPPNVEHYRDKWTEEPTWFQVYENVSEGTPVTPPFATKAEVIEYLVTRGDFWDQKRGHGGWQRAAAERFVEHEYAPSFIVTTGPEGVSIQPPGDQV